MDYIDEFIYLCYQVDNILGEGNLIDSDFASDEHNCFRNNPIPKEEVIYRLENLKDTVTFTNIIDTTSAIYISKHIDALLALLNTGEREFIETISILYDIEAQKPKHEEIEMLHNQLDGVLSECGYNKGSLNDRLFAWNMDNTILSSNFIYEAQQKVEEYKKIVRDLLIDLVSFDEIDDRLELKSVQTDQGWAAYNYYLTNYTGIVEFNSKSTFNKYSLNTFISHEGYPGHHTSCAVKEYLYRKGRINSLVTLNLLNTPSSLIEEGIGDCGLKILNIRDDDINLQVEALSDELSATAYYYADYLYYSEKKSSEKVMESLLNDKLHHDEKSANRAFSFIKNWGYYIPTYKYGRKIVGDYLKKGKPDYLRLYGICCNTILTQ